MSDLYSTDHTALARAIYCLYPGTFKYPKWELDPKGQKYRCVYYFEEPAYMQAVEVLFWDRHLPIDAITYNESLTWAREQQALVKPT